MPTMHESNLDTMFRILAISPQPSSMADPKEDSRSFERHLTEADPGRHAPAAFRAANGRSPAQSSRSETDRQNGPVRPATDRPAGESSPRAATHRSTGTDTDDNDDPPVSEQDSHHATDPSHTDTPTEDKATDQEATEGTLNPTTDRSIVAMAAIDPAADPSAGTDSNLPPDSAAGQETETPPTARPGAAGTDPATASAAGAGGDSASAQGLQEHQAGSLPEDLQIPIPRSESTANPTADSVRAEETDPHPMASALDSQTQNLSSDEEPGTDSAQNTVDPEAPESGDRKVTEMTATAGDASLAESRTQESQGLQDSSDQRLNAASHVEKTDNRSGLYANLPTQTTATDQVSPGMETGLEREHTADESAVETNPRFATDGVGRGLASQQPDSASNAAHPIGRTLDYGTAADRSHANTSIDRFRIDPERFVARVTKAFQTAEDRGGQLRLRLSPPELGSIRLELTVKNGAVTAMIETDTAAARHVLLDNLPALRDRLADQNIRIEQFQIDVRDDSAGGQPGQTTEDSRQPFPFGRPDRLHSKSQGNDHQITANRAIRIPRSRGDEMLDVVV